MTNNECSAGFGSRSASTSKSQPNKSKRRRLRSAVKPLDSGYSSVLTLFYYFHFIVLICVRVRYLRARSLSRAPPTARRPIARRPLTSRSPRPRARRAAPLHAAPRRTHAAPRRTTPHTHPARQCSLFQTILILFQFRPPHRPTPTRRRAPPTER